MEIRSLVFLSICVAYVFGGHIEPGRCPVLPGTRDFDLNKFQGEWKSISRLPSDTEKDDISCESIKYTYKFDHRVEFLIRHKNADGKMTQQSSTGEKTYIKSMIELRKDHFSPEYHHWMFQYQNYTYGLLVSCSEAMGLFHIEKVWIVSRSSTIDQSAMNEIHDDLSRMGLGSRKFSQVSHENCNESDPREDGEKEEGDGDQEADGYEFFEIVDDESDLKNEKDDDSDDQSNKTEKQDKGDEEVEFANKNREVAQSDGNDSGAKIRSEEDSEKVSIDKNESDEIKLDPKDESNDQKSEDSEKEDKSRDEELIKENQRSGEDTENKESVPANKIGGEDEKTIEQQTDQNQSQKSEEQSEKINLNHKREVPFAYEGRNNQVMGTGQSSQSGNNFQQQNGFKVVYDRGDGEQSFGGANPMSPISNMVSQQTSGSNPFNPSVPINFAPANNVVYDRNEGNPGFSTYSTDQYQVIQPYDISAYLEIIERWKQERAAQTSSDSSSSSSSSDSGGSGRSESDRDRLKQIKERGGLANSAADIKRQKEKQKQILKQRGFAVRAGKEKAGGPGGGQGLAGRGHRHR
ncbi:uncharacterized protein LOC141857325 [Brevipalpus obovatus]|uniref:uncharacterized protein LOC141857325 n=1 Tax=Brevipalpus obovatus TaxID=246614 RepID=UPI003D9EA2A6